MTQEYRNQHYVPQWYQRRFVDSSAPQRELHYLALKPGFVTDSKGKRRSIPAQRRRPLSRCFAEDNLYTVQLGDEISTLIEREFFGEIDRQGARAVAWWGEFEHPSLERHHLFGLLEFMSSQKLRTPKGLAWLQEQREVQDRPALLSLMMKLRSLYVTIWGECVWQIADATESPTKFIVTDHPVTVYNRECGPRHLWCRDASDPDIRLHGSHTIFPLDLNRVLILTNRSWVENPYQSARGLRPNPEFYRDSYFNIFDVQTGRTLTEKEVLQINFILKSRAYRYVAAGRPEWLHPEEFVSKSDWATYGDGYLLMPDPRELHAGGAVAIGYSDGSVEAFDSQGHRPWDPGYQGADLPVTHRSLRRFKQEFSELFGEHRRGGPYNISEQAGAGGEGHANSPD
jgi:hypothetical protein